MHSASCRFSHTSIFAGPGRIYCRSQLRSTFFRTLKKLPKWENKSNLGRSRDHFSSKSIRRTPPGAGRFKLNNWIKAGFTVPPKPPAGSKTVPPVTKGYLESPFWPPFSGTIFCINFWTSFFPSFSAFAPILAPILDPFCLHFPTFLHHFFGHRLCIDFWWIWGRFWDPWNSKNRNITGDVSQKSTNRRFRNHFWGVLLHWFLDFFENDESVK